MADGFLSGLARRASEWREDAEDRSEPYRREGWRRARRGGGDAMGELRRLWSRIEELVEDRLSSSTSDRARRAGETAADYARSAGDTASHYARRARRLARDYGPQAREAAEYAATYLRDAARARPLVAIGIAIAATWLVASMLQSDRRHRHD